ncbi:MAG: nucleotidyltransferase family protein [Cyanobacteria bacterium P01_E01_bin.6]
MCTLQAVAIILAAGFSRRMGQCKASLPWAGKDTLLTYQMLQFINADVFPIVILGRHNEHLQYADVPKSGTFAVNSDASRGKVSSILVGLNQLPSQWDAVFISAVDQPRSTVVYRKLLNAFAQYHAPITIPSYQGRTGHPILFSRALLPQLYAIQEETCGLRQVVNDYSTTAHYIEIEHMEVLSDLNTPAHYQQALPGA